MNDFNPDVLAKSPILASALGSLVGMRFAPGASWVARVTNGVGGFASAIYGTQLLTWFLKLESVGAIAGLSFLVGILSMVVIDALVQGLRETRLGGFLNGVLDRLLSFVGKKEG